MLSHFAAAAETMPADPISFYWTQGVLGVTVIALIIVIRFMWNYFTKKLDEKDVKIDTLQNARLDDNKVHTADYREMAKNDQAVLLGVSQTQELMAGKIEAVKGQR